MNDNSNEDYKGWTITRKGGPRRVQITKNGEAHIFTHQLQARAFIDEREEKGSTKTKA